jgi:hypothetical protein
MEPVLIAICGAVAVWAIGKTASAVVTLREQRRNAESLARSGDRDGSSGAGGIDPGSIVCNDGHSGHGHGSHCGGGHGHGGGDCGGHGGDW